MAKIQGIYKITNILNKQCYIGESSDIDARIKIHFYDLENNRHHSKCLQNDFNLYGRDVFKIEILEIIKDHDLLLIAEKFYIDKFNSYDDGYNMTYPKLFTKDITQDEKQNILMILDLLYNNEFIHLSGDVLNDVKTYMAPKVFFESFSIIVDYMKWLRKYFINLSCEIEYKKTKKIIGETLYLQIYYYEDLMVKYCLNKDIKLSFKGLCGSLAEYDSEFLRKVSNKKLIDIKKQVIFWE